MTFDSSLLLVFFITACLGLKEFWTKIKAENIDGQLYQKRFAARRSDCEKCSVVTICWLILACFYDDPLNHAVISTKNNFAENRRDCESRLWQDISYIHFHSIRHLSGLSPDKFYFHYSTVVTSAASFNYSFSFTPFMTTLRRVQTFTLTTY